LQKLSDQLPNLAQAILIRNLHRTADQLVQESDMSGKLAVMFVTRLSSLS
jgi:hypothetical protein